jgi:uncharacterized LabA/DUF88 family protein
MRTNVYIDGFNLYYGCLKGTNHKWLDLAAFCEASFPPPRNQINRIRYFTAHVNARPNDPQQPQRQQTFLRALRTIPHLEVHLGSYLEKPTRMPLHPLPAVGPKTVMVMKSEEKGSDVNLASYLLVDAFENDYEAAVVISNDSDLAEPIRLVKRKFGKPVIVLHPCGPGRTLSYELRMSASKSLRLNASLLPSCQFPPTLTDAAGRTIHKPASW